MAVQFLNDIDLNQNELIDAVIENQDGDVSAGTGIDGQLYYDTTDDVLKVWTGSAWTSVGSDTYTLTGVGSTNGTAKVRLSDGTTNNDVAFTGTGSVTVTQSGNILIINGTDNQGVTSITAGAGITGSNLSSASPTIDVDYAGSDNVILAAGDGVTTPITVASTDKIIINDGSDSDNVKYVAISQITAAIGGGTVTSVGAGDGMVQTGDAGVNPTLDVVGGDGILSLANNIEIDYTATGIIHDANSGTSITLVDTDEFLFEDVGSTAGTAVKRGTLSQLKTYIGGSDTTYTLPVSAGGANSSVITLDASSGTDTTVTFNGTTNEIALTESTGVNGSITIGLPDDVTITDDLTVGGIITQSQTGETNTFASEVAVPTATSSGNAPNLGQVQSLIAGVGIFQGGYNATTGLTTDLSSNGSLDGASNIELDKGDYFVVTVAGGAFYSETLEVGDMIYANQDITANSTPAQTVYTVVIQDENIAGSGSTDGGTQKGVAGFDSDTFTVSASGWVQSKVFNGLQPGVVPNTSGNSASVFLNGQGAFTTPPNYYVTTASFDDTTGVLTISGNNAVVGDTVDLDGRYLTDNQTIQLGGDLSGSGTTNITATIVNDAVEASMLNDNVISGQAGTLGTTPEGTDQLLISDGGTIKKINYSVLIGGADSGVTTVSPDTANSKLGIAVLNPSTANPKVGLDINGLASAVPVGSDTIPFYDAGTNKKTTVSNLTAAVQTATSKAYTIASGETTADLTYPFTLTAATINDVMVQAVISSGTNTGETVFCDVDRISTTVCRITFGSALTTSVRVLVQKIG